RTGQGSGLDVTRGSRTAGDLEPPVDRRRIRDQRGLGLPERVHVALLAVVRDIGAAAIQSARDQERGDQGRQREDGDQREPALSAHGPFAHTPVGQGARLMLGRAGGATTVSLPTPGSLTSPLTRSRVCPILRLIVGSPSPPCTVTREGSTGLRELS